MDKKINYSLPESASFEEVFKKLLQNFIIKSEKGKKEEIKLCDTFDWRLFREGCTLLQTKEGYEVITSPGEVVVEIASYAGKDTPVFWWDFPESGLKARLRSILGVRALLGYGNFSRESRRYAVLNEDQKTVLKFEFELILIPLKRRKIEWLRLIPLKGYRKEFQAFQKILLSLNCLEDSANHYQKALEMAGFQPGDYSSKLTVRLDPSMTLHQSALLIFRQLSDVMKVNIAGMKSDLDSEFLHDFRVAIRRTRSALGQMKGIFLDPSTAKFKTDFSFLGRSTNRMRDLDVFLQKKEDYASVLPEKLRPGLIFFFHDLELKRKTEHRQLLRFLNSVKFSEILKKWEKFLSEEEKMERSDLKVIPVQVAAKKIIFKRYQKVLTAGESLVGATSFSAFHRLRIEAKKLRYLLEFFSSLFPEKEITFLVKHLKKMQDILGDFNDLIVQQNFLETYLVTLKSSDKNSIKTAASIGGLIVHLSRRQQTVQKSFKQTFEKFRQWKTKVMYLRLFSDENK